MFGATTVVTKTAMDAMFFWSVGLCAVQCGLLQAYLTSRELAAPGLRDWGNWAGAGVVTGGLVAGIAYWLCIGLLAWALPTGWVLLAGSNSGPGWAGVRADMVAVWLFAPGSAAVLTSFFSVRVIRALSRFVGSRRRDKRFALATPAEVGTDLEHR